MHAYYAGHPGAVLAQALLVHGIAGLALAVVAMSLPGSTTGPLRRSARAAGLTAAFLSLFQATVSAAATHGARSTAPSQSLAYFHAINMTDFVKLIALAAFVSTTTALVAGPGRLSAFLKTVGRFLLILLPLGGSSFLFPNPVCEAALDLSLVLLLCWTAALGACVRSRQRLTLVLGGC
ncbi:hypothetical protein AQJ66_24545 [Streptomyces bungoensis]|uniref:Uncharacterized protein n=1 Tax=Streptomyces bungoensis TaxID=285568 RepID=A0A124I2P2_9ACTN|nr:hypothetical protein AQJ66_24545 [Streptomyces bungoensis]